MGLKKDIYPRIIKIYKSKCNIKIKFLIKFKIDIFNNVIHLTLSNFYKSLL